MPNNFKRRNFYKNRCRPGIKYLYHLLGDKKSSLLYLVKISTAEHKNNFFHKPILHIIIVKSIGTFIAPLRI